LRRPKDCVGEDSRLLYCPVLRARFYRIRRARRVRYGAGLSQHASAPLSSPTSPPIRGLLPCIICVYVYL
jgi:hypothetical protein